MGADIDERQRMGSLHGRQVLNQGDGAGLSVPTIAVTETGKGTKVDAERRNMDQITKRLDKQDEMLKSIHDTLLAHLTVDEEMKPALDELVSLWKGSKIISGIIAFICAAGAAVWALFVWAKDHIK